jgi:IclR family acetate operon transcriptional repressor
VNASDEDKTDRYTVRSVARALDILDVIAESRNGLTLTEIAAAIHTSKSATYSLLRTMVDRAHLREVEGGPRYQLGVTLLQLADAALAHLPLGEVARPVLSALSEELAMTTRIALADDGQPVFVDRVDGPGTVRFHTPMGKRELPHASSAGKAILACLPESRVRAICAESGMPGKTVHTIVTPEALLADLALVRERGFALDDEEDAEGVFCAGAAFFDHRGNCAGAISATSIKSGISDARIVEIGAAVRARADQISALLGGPRYGERKTL